ncbi:MAG: hypothetical protein WEC75_08330 [Dehalococcoidia bacterium]
MHLFVVLAAGALTLAAGGAAALIEHDGAFSMSEKTVLGAIAFMGFALATLSGVCWSIARTEDLLLIEFLTVQEYRNERPREA